MVHQNGQVAKSMTPFFDARLEVARQAHFVPEQSFTVGRHQNNKGESIGSLSLLAYAIAANMNRRQALELFGEHYDAVLLDPLGTNHQNIRALLADGTDSSPISDIVILSDYGVSISMIEGWWEELSTISSSSDTSDLQEEVQWVLQYIEDGVLTKPDEGADSWINKALEIAELLELLSTPRRQAS